MLQYNCVRIVTGAPLYISNKKIHEDLSVPFLAELIRGLIESLDSKLVVAGKLLFRQLSKYLTEGWPKSPRAHAKCGDGQQAERGSL